MKKTMLSIVCLGLMTSQVFGLGGIVYDPANEAQNIKTAMQTLQMAGTLKSRFDMAKENLSNLAGLRNLLSDNKDVINSFFGNSDYAKLGQLDPDSGNYAENRDDILKKYYTLPQDPNTVRSSLGGLMSPDMLNQWTADAEQNKNNWDRVTDTLGVVAKENAVSLKRQQSINEFKDQLNNLGGKSQLKTEQLIAAEMLFLLQQNENQNAEIRSMQKSAANNLAEKTSAAAQDFNREEQRAKAAANQGSEIPNIKTWSM